MGIREYTKNVRDEYVKSHEENRGRQQDPFRKSEIIRRQEMESEGIEIESSKNTLREDEKKRVEKAGIGEIGEGYRYTIKI